MNRQNSKDRSPWLWIGLIALCIGAPALADPPGRVARLSYANGSVSFEPAGSQDWVQAELNRPMTTGDSLWADSDSRAELNIGRVAARLDSQTSVTVTNLDDQTAQFQLSQGTLELSVHRLDPGDVVEIDTPNLAFTATSPGTYRLNVAADGSSTFVAVDSGQANVTGQGQAYTIGNRQAYSFTGTDLSNSAHFEVPPPDDFDRFVASREQRFADSPSARYVSPDMIGYEDLDNNGTWSDVEGYGHVWQPAGVEVGWAPYHTGNWAWVDPYGWTWVDAAPWGFAPFHYGRWAMIGPRWGWIPGPVAVAPVYAPALVGFVGGGPGIGVSVSLGLGVGVGVGIGWFPLGPREVYVPPYAVSPAYVGRVNISNTNVTNTYVTNVYNHTTVVNNYVNQRVPGAMTAMPASAFGQGAAVAKVGVTVPANLAVSAHVTAVAAVVPTARALAPSAAAAVRPPAQALARPVIAATAPPPAPVPFSAKQQALAQNPGRPLTPEATASVRASLPPSVHAAIARPVTVVQPPAGARVGAAAAATHAAPPSAATPAAARSAVAQPAARAATPPSRTEGTEFEKPASVTPRPPATPHPPAQTYHPESTARPPAQTYHPESAAHPPAESARPQVEARPPAEEGHPQATSHPEGHPPPKPEAHEKKEKD